MENLLFLRTHPFLSIMIWCLLLVTAMYLARKAFQNLMTAFGRLIYTHMRLAAAWVKAAEKRLQLRNREILVGAALERAESRIEREFERIGAAVQRDLEKYPQLRRQIKETLLKVEEDHQHSSEIPLALPDWVKVIDALAAIQPSGDRTVIHMLEKLHQTLGEQHKAALACHRRDLSRRHALLSRMLPLWRKAQKSIGEMEKAMLNLIQRARKIDQYVAEYLKILQRSSTTERQLCSSSFAKFCFSAAVMVVAAAVGLVNFNLIALPMSEMVGGQNTIGTMKISEIAGMLVVGLEVVLGFFIMDALRVTRFSSVCGSMGEKQRRTALVILLFFLTMLSGLEVTLAFVRDRMAADLLELRHELAGGNREVTANKVPLIGQMLMGFILPYLLIFTAVPFESFLSSLRTVLGKCCTAGLRLLIFMLRAVGHLGLYAARLAMKVYDLLIFPALWLESLMVRRQELQADWPKLEQEAGSAAGPPDDGLHKTSRPQELEAE